MHVPARGPCFWTAGSYFLPRVFFFFSPRQVHREAAHCIENFPIYYNICGWQEGRFPPGQGHQRLAFVCVDSAQMGRCQFGNNQLREYPLTTHILYARAPQCNFGGLICIEDQVDWGVRGVATMGPELLDKDIPLATFHIPPPKY